MTPTGPAKYRSAGERCRKKAKSSSNQKEWIRYAQEWEKLAQSTEALTMPSTDDIPALSR
jgi:hypothetical protein